MPRTSKAEKAKTHETLLAIASEQLRQNGFAGFGVSDVMHAAGLTHGGFYRHFKNREDLAVSATERAFSEFIARLEQDLETAPEGEALPRFIDRYLSVPHLETPAKGCPVATLTAEADRCSALERAEIARGTERLITLLERALRQAGVTEVSGATLLAVLAGAINLARLRSRDGSQEAALAEARGAVRALGIAVPD